MFGFRPELVYSEGDAGEPLEMGADLLLTEIGRSRLPEYKEMYMELERA